MSILMVGGHFGFSFFFIFALIFLSSLFDIRAQGPSVNTIKKLSNPLVGDDGRVYTCMENNFIAFESNGSVAWTTRLNHTCHEDLSPVRDATGKIYVVAENQVVVISPPSNRTSQTFAEDFFNDEQSSNEIIGLAISFWGSSLFINIKMLGLFAFMIDGTSLWSVGPVLHQSGYPQGCKSNETSCYFASTPVVDQCEGSVYITNSEGQVYSFSALKPYINWIQDFSTIDKLITVTSGNNGRVYLAFPRRAILMALDATNGYILWEETIGPLRTQDCSPVVDSSGWVSIGSLDGFVYVVSPTGVIKKHLEETAPNAVVQVNPILDCSGRAVYVAQLRTKSKKEHNIGGSTYTSALQPVKLVFSKLLPATGKVYFTAEYPGHISSLWSDSYLRHFLLDARVLLAFVSSANIGNPFPCKSSYEKLMWGCSHAKPNTLKIAFLGNEKKTLIFLGFQFCVVIVLAGCVWFCCTFWNKQKLKKQGLGGFLEKRRSLHLRKKMCDRMISDLEKKMDEEGVEEEQVMDKLGETIAERETIEEKLSTTYSLGRDTSGRSNKVVDKDEKGYTWSQRRDQSMSMFHTVSATSSSSEKNEPLVEEEESQDEWRSFPLWYDVGDKGSAVKGKAPVNDMAESSSRLTDSTGFTNPLFEEPQEVVDEYFEKELKNSGSCLKRRRTLS
ncbi:protein GAMETE EXPRESSED 3 isoform X1 [Amborella trichopoda]|uniref:protein GAMETE EXPRESSED 3 isoform X1 n=2 Tax=Amborella trichopoda TaxID=13333 RepID=UPI0009BFF875|nr:protein GAMETE EXPRESSED 3 isoform X1 [Amborella trichopoda]|eukprot:XP_020527396.1 protein GAMETE EXPRESSED 3 isoform X1 [Amborella trichopoda]